MPRRNTVVVVRSRRERERSDSHNEEDLFHGFDGLLQVFWRKRPFIKMDNRGQAKDSGKVFATRETRLVAKRAKASRG
jgi:hypothetical protein